MFKSFVVGLFACVALVAFFVLTSQPVKSNTKPASSTVYVDVGRGHGSGVHIGNGLVLTAWHVVDEASNVSVKDNNGVVHETEVMWSNKPYDIALLRIKDFKSVKSRSLSCRYLDKGESLSFEGNPFSLELLTSWGKVAKSEIKTVGDWKEVYIIDGTIGPGMSGGPALDKNDRVIGINVGMAVSTNFIMIVPSRTVCALLAR